MTRLLTSGISAVQYCYEQIHSDTPSHAPSATTDSGRCLRVQSLPVTRNSLANITINPALNTDTVVSSDGVDGVYGMMGMYHGFTSYVSRHTNKVLVI